MKRVIVFLVSAAVLGAVIMLVLELRWHIPANAGGAVDVEVDMGRVSAGVGRMRMIRKLSEELKQNPKAKRFRVFSQWSDCGIYGKRVIVYDRSAQTVTSWLEGKNVKHWFGSLSRANYANVQESDIHQIGNADFGGWMKLGRGSSQFDFLQKYGCTKVE